MYAAVGALLSHEGFIAVIPNYIKYPAGGIEEICNDATQVIQWAQSPAIQEFGGDSDNVVLIGHSSGAHVWALIVATAAAAVAAAAEPVDSRGHRTASGGRAYPVLKVAGLILLSGPYDISSHFQFEAGRGVEWISPMHRASLIRCEAPLSCSSAVPQPRHDNWLKLHVCDKSRSRWLIPLTML